jgi:hypothetical protein
VTNTYRVTLEDESDKSLRLIAQKRRMSPEDTAELFVLLGLENARLQGVRYLTACLITAATVLFGVWLLAVSLPSPAVAPRALHWLRELVLLFTPWPLTILIALLIMASSESFIGLLIGISASFRKIKLFGAEIELNEQTKRRIQSAASDIEAALQDYKERADTELARVVARYQVEQQLSKFIDSDEVRSFRADEKREFRCTIHVPDPVHYGRLYQLVDYCPTGTGRGRDFSTRYGIIGKVWRTEKMRIANDLFHAKEAQRTHEDEIDEIMSDWGMDRREAENALKHRSYFCFPLVFEDRKVGLLYLDAKEKDSFDEAKAPAVSARAQTELAQLVAKVLDDAAALFLQLELN